MLRYVLVSAAIVAFRVGCGSDSSLIGKCESRSGTYRSRYVERSGTCGLVPEQIFSIDGQPFGTTRSVHRRRDSLLKRQP